LYFKTTEVCATVLVAAARAPDGRKEGFCFSIGGPEVEPGGAPVNASCCEGRGALEREELLGEGERCRERRDECCLGSEVERSRRREDL
jgi:hypothetical protein